MNEVKEPVSFFEALETWQRASDKAKEQRAINKVLNKIRSEIIERQKDYHEYGWAYDDVLELIDKYRAESEAPNEPEQITRS